jgi:hypothetical protein
MQRNNCAKKLCKNLIIINYLMLEKEKTTEMSKPMNREINSLFEDWLLNPKEAPDIEAKCWLDMNDIESRGAIAKALIALENHGGGYLVIGFSEDASGVLSPDPNRPTNLSAFGTDEINAIINKYAEPTFHVHVTFQKNPDSGDEFPVIRAPGTSKVPVRSDSETPGGTIKNKVYYIRRPGPKSEAPLDGLEWDALIRRSVLNQRSEIIDILRSFYGNEWDALMRRSVLNQRSEIMDTLSSFIPAAAPGNLKAIVDEREVLNQFTRDSFARWTSINDSLKDDHLAKIKLGYFSFSCQVIGKSKGLTTWEILSSVEGLRRYTGWPIFVALHRPESKPYLIDGALEASLVNIQRPSPAHADFWRIHPDGLFYLLRGYQEDCLETLSGSRTVRPPGTGIDLTIPTWRVAEFLLRSDELARSMFEDGFTMLVRCEWTGLKERELFMFNPRRMIFDGHRCKAPSVTTEQKLTQDVIENLLPEAVKRLVNPLYEHFALFQPPNKFFEEEITLMRTGQMG